MKVDMERIAVSLRLGACLLLLGTVPACRRGSEAKKPVEPQAVRVEVAKAERHTFRGVVPVTGELRPIQEVTLKSRVGGNVVELNFDEGDVVKKGQVIARIENVNQRAQLRGARAQVLLFRAQAERARAELEKLLRDKARIETLYARGAADRKSLDDITSAIQIAQAAVKTAEAQVLAAEAQRDGAENSVAETIYRAPFSGVIARRGVHLHEYIDTFKNRDIVTIVDNSQMELVAAVPADLAGGVTRGAQVEFTVGALAGKTLSGAVIAVSPSADARTRTIRLRVIIPNENGVLKGGMYATGTVTVGGERTHPGVPAQAVRSRSVGGAGLEGEQLEQVVWRVRDGVAEQVMVRTGITDDDLVEIYSGIEVGDHVVVSSPAALKPGAKVVAIFPGQAAPEAGASASGS